MDGGETYWVADIIQNFTNTLTAAQSYALTKACHGRAVVVREFFCCCFCMMIFTYL